MRLDRVIACAAALALAAGAAHAADSQLSCKGEAMVMPDQSSAPLDVTLTLAGGLQGPSSVTYAWGRPEAPVPMDLKGLIGDVLSFHGMAPAKEGGVQIADVQLNRTTLALVLKVRRIGSDNAQDITLETTCRAA